MLQIRFLKAGIRIGEDAPDTLKSARERISRGFDDADQAVVVRVKPDGANEYVEVQQIPRTAKS
jgi:hypothetical protein